jgi:hypothetical protein
VEGPCIVRTFGLCLSSSAPSSAAAAAPHPQPQHARMAIAALAPCLSLADAPSRLCPFPTALAASSSAGAAPASAAAAGGGGHRLRTNTAAPGAGAGSEVFYLSETDSRLAEVSFLLQDVSGAAPSPVPLTSIRGDRWDWTADTEEAGAGAPSVSVQALVLFHRRTGAFTRLAFRPSALLEVANAALDPSPLTVYQAADGIFDQRGGARSNAGAIVGRSAICAADYDRAAENIAKHLVAELLQEKGCDPALALAESGLYGAAQSIGISGNGTAAAATDAAKGAGNPFGAPLPASASAASLEGGCEMAPAEVSSSQRTIDQDRGLLTETSAASKKAHGFWRQMEERGTAPGTAPGAGATGTMRAGAASILAGPHLTPVMPALSIITPAPAPSAAASMKAAGKRFLKLNSWRFKGKGDDKDGGSSGKHVVETPGASKKRISRDEKLSLETAWKAVCDASTSRSTRNIVLDAESDAILPSSDVLFGLVTEEGMARRIAASLEQRNKHQRAEDARKAEEISNSAVDVEADMIAQARNLDFALPAMSLMMSYNSFNMLGESAIHTAAMEHVAEEPSSTEDQEREEDRAAEGAEDEPLFPSLNIAPSLVKAAGRTRLSTNADGKEFELPPSPRSLIAEVYNNLLQDLDSSDEMGYTYHHLVGTVKKRGHVFASWKRRWFGLEGMRCLYFIDKHPVDYVTSLSTPSSNSWRANLLGDAEDAITPVASVASNLDALGNGNTQTATSGRSTPSEFVPYTMRDRPQVIVVPWPLEKPLMPMSQGATARQIKASRQHQGKRRGFFIISPYSRVWSVDLAGIPFAFCVTTTDPQKPYLCSAPSAGARDDWVQVLRHNVIVRQSFERRVALWRAVQKEAALHSVLHLPPGQFVDILVNLDQVLPDFGTAPLPP